MGDYLVLVKRWTEVTINYMEQVIGRGGTTEETHLDGGGPRSKRSVRAAVSDSHYFIFVSACRSVRDDVIYKSVT